MGEETQNLMERERGKREGDLINNNNNTTIVDQGYNNHANENAGKSVTDRKA